MSGVLFRNRLDPDNVPGLPTITWTQQTRTGDWPAGNGYLNIYYDAVAQRTLIYAAYQGSVSIYSTDVYAYNAATSLWTVHSGGNQHLVNTCGTGNAGWPHDRHPVSMQAIDTRRNRWWLSRGVCNTVNQTDLWYMTLNADFTSNTWTDATPAHLPTPADSAALVYDPVSDVLFLFGSDNGAQTHDNWVYGPTDLNSIPGTLTAAQTAAGCTAADDWCEVSVVGGVIPSGPGFPGLLYDRTTNTVIQFAGQDGSGAMKNETWAYTVPTKTWTQKALGTTPPPVNNGSFNVNQPPWCDIGGGRLVYRQTTNTGSPKDWLYDTVRDRWTSLSSSGTGPTVDGFYMAYDPVHNLIVAVARNGVTLYQDVFHGALG